MNTYESESSTGNDHWWLTEGREYCTLCEAPLHPELLIYCIACDRPICSLCLNETDQGEQNVCPECAKKTEGGKG